MKEVTPTTDTKTISKGRPPAIQLQQQSQRMLEMILQNSQREQVVEITSQWSGVSLWLNLNGENEQKLKTCGTPWIYKVHTFKH